ncbi:conserved hypothetical protein [Thermotomaculum hydrothermale]|uniref:Secondary thiamine-phosphate synthase enzyme n=1 Tax=Thermotomaculum hydrothermale TaxID=981385 RepID=A0A7R6SYI6_9BACT|nr:secondary thiamine-phosphate synthase enzyme YjbQ [Thermotomaculum hydrothermale]BBB31890.1 conserved hypothetical protein [Thermotomaculum hydrothermale]
MAQSVLTVSTSSRNEMIDITHKIEGFLQENGCKNGILTVFVPHTTAAVTINENADPSVKRDILTYLSKLIPQNADFRHLEGNSDSHIKSTLVSPSITVIVENGRIVLGTWQSIFFCEFDGPRTRKVYLKFIEG